MLKEDPRCGVNITVKDHVCTRVNVALCSDSVYLCLLVIHNAFIQLVMREVSHGSNIA